MATLDQTLKDKIATQAFAEMKAGLDWKKNRMTDIKANENLYANKPEPALPGQFSIPLPIMGGFVDTLVAEENVPVKVNFDKQEMGDLKKAKWATGLWEYDSSPNRGAWDIKDLRGKKLAAFSGRAIFNIFSESDPIYKSTLRNVHHYNFYIEGKAGADIEDAQYLGEINCFKSEYDIKQGGMSKLYDQTQVDKLISAYNAETFKQAGALFADIKNSFEAMGLKGEDLTGPNGTKMFAMAQMYTTYEGVRYYVFGEPLTKTAVRVVPLTELFTKRKSPKWPYKSWATHDDPANFWSKAPADDVRSIAISMKEAFDQSFNELLQRIRGKRAIDPNYFPNRAELEDFTTRFVEATVPAGKNIRDGFVEFTTPDNTAIVVNIMRFLNSLLGEKTGVNSASQGQAQEDKVGIYYGNIQQVARRMNLYSSFFKQCYAQLGEAWLDGAMEHLKGKMSIRILGANGYEGVSITREDIQFETDPDINVTGGSDQQQANDQKNTKKQAALTLAFSNPAVTAQYNPKWLAEQNLVVGGWDPDEIKRALDLDTYGDQEIISAAYEAMQLIMEGESPMPNREANTAFLQTINDFVQDHPELDQPTYLRIMVYFQKHVPIALQNKIRQARFIQMQKMAGATVLPGAGGPGGPAGGGAPGGGLPAPAGGGAPAVLPAGGGGAPLSTGGGAQ